MTTTTTTTLPIELHVLSFGSSFNIEGCFDAAIIMEDENAKIDSIIYIELHEFKYFLEERNGFEFPETEDRNNFMAYLEEDSEKGKTGIEFVNSCYSIMQFLNNFINSDYNTLSKTVKQ
jgi:hypothetical protein